jgi:hypothetical protein
MARQQIDLSKELRERIAENPERSVAMAAICGFAVGGGLSGRTMFKIVLTVLEGMLGNRLIPALVPSTGRNGKRPRDKR